MVNYPSPPSFLKLSEALAWIAFGDVSDSEGHWSNYDEAKGKLEDALVILLDKGASGAIELVGRFDLNSGSPYGAVDTTTISRQSCHDFQMYDQSCNGLRRGHPPQLLWFGEKVCDDSGERFETTLMDGLQGPYYRDVHVLGEDLYALFPKSLASVISTCKAEDACRTWLEQQFWDDKEGRQTRQRLKQLALQEFEKLSGRGFGRVWDDVAPKFQRNLPGAKKSKR